MCLRALPEPCVTLSRRFRADMPIRYQTILLDLDGTLTDPREGITRCIRHALGLLGAVSPPGDDLTWCIGPPLKDSFAALLQSDDEALLQKAVQFYRDRFTDVGIYENRVYPGIPEALFHMAGSGLDLVLATSKPLVFAGRVLEHFELSGMFSRVFGSELDGRLTNKGELIRHILDELGLDPTRTLMVGDRVHDIDGARQCGVASAAAAWGYGSSREISLARPDHVFRSPLEMAEFLAGRGVPC